MADLTLNLFGWRGYVIIKSLCFCYTILLGLVHEDGRMPNNQNGIVNALPFFFGSRLELYLHADGDFHSPKCYEINSIYVS